MVSDTKKRIEQGFIRLAKIAYGYPYLILAAGFVLIGWFAFQACFIKVNTASEALLRENDPKRLQYDEFRTQFGRPELIIILVQTDEIFKPEFIDQLNAFHNSLEQTIPFIRSVTSLVNVQQIQYQNRQFTVEKLFKDLPRADIEKIKKQAIASRLYKNYLLSADAKATAVMIETLARVGEDQHFLGAWENQQVVLAVKQALEKYNRPGFELTASGEPVIEDAFNQATMADLKVCVSLALFMVCFFLILLFQRVSGVFLSMMITIFTLISTLGLMAIFNIQVKITTIVMPAFLVAVSVAASVHLLVIFFRNHEKTHDKRQAIASALGHSGLAITMTSLTTAAGLLSFSFAEIVAIAEIGYLSAAGVMLSFFYTIFLVPAMLAVIPLSEKKYSRHSTFLDRTLSQVATFSFTHPKKIIYVSCALLVLSVFFISSLKFSHDLLRFFPEHSKERQDMLKIDQIMKGSLSLELVFSHDQKDVFDLDMLNHMNAFSQEIKDIKMPDLYVGKVFSMVDVIKAANQSYQGDAAFFMIPQSQKMITHVAEQIAKNKDSGMERFVHLQSGKNRMTVMTTWTDAMIFKEFISKITEKFHQRFDGQTHMVTTGLISLLAQATHAATVSMAKSYVIAFLVITLMMILMLGQFRLGIVSMFPNLLPICLIMGLMSILKTPFDLNSLMIGSIAIGLVVDDTVHFMVNFQRYYQQTGNVQDSILTTFLGTGKAMLITSLVLSAGFFVLQAATLSHVSRFGIYTGMVILVALVADFLLAPALMVVMHQNRS